MRKTFYCMITLTFCSISFATTFEGVVPVLRYDKSIIVEKSGSDKTLAVMPGVTTFRKKGKQKVKFQKALGMIQEVMNSKEFKRRVITYTRSDGKRLYQKNYLWNDSKNRLSNEDVYEILMEGNEYMVPNTLGEMNINSYVRTCSWWKARTSKWCRAVVGSTSPRRSKWIRLNWKFYSRFEVHEIVANLVHEWIHL